MKLFLKNRDRLGEVGSGLVDELDSMTSRIRGAWKLEHTDDGEHANVHAETVASGRLTFSDITNATLTNTQEDNYEPSGLDTAAILRLDSSLSEVTITGLKVPQDSDETVLDGRVLIVENISTACVIRVVHQSSSSLSRNRFELPRVGAAASTSATLEIRLYPGTFMWLQYNAPKTVWVAHTQANDYHIGFIEFGSSQNNWLPLANWPALRTLRIGATALDLTVSGLSITSIPDTDRKTLVNDGLYKVTFLHANTNSSEANRIYCPGGAQYQLHPRESVELQRIAGGGWRLVEKADQWIDVIYAGGNFTTDTGTWTVASGDVTTHNYQIDGNMITVAFDLRTTTIAAGSPTELRIVVPDGRTIARTTQNRIIAANAGTEVSTAYVQALAGNTYIQCFQNLAATAWSGTDNVRVSGQITFMVRDADISEPHTDVSHGDTSHSDVEHSDVAHSDVAHGDSHSDTAHEDVSHADQLHGDEHGDSHTDTHDDVAHVDTHSDAAHQDETIHVDHQDVGHADQSQHVDQGHGDEHGDSHTDTHGDVSHVDTHSDSAHQDTAHLDGGHSDSHSDTAPHQDVAHIDNAHSDTAHADSAHQDIGQHTDTSHIDI